MSHLSSRSLSVVAALLTAACSGSLTTAPAAAEDRTEAMPIVDELEREARAAAEGVEDTAKSEPVHDPAHAAAEAKPATLRRLRGSELNPALVREASRIIRSHYRQPIGTIVPFELEGQKYVGRIEQHYHPEGGALRPWGLHKGCSLFAVEG